MKKNRNSTPTNFIALSDFNKATLESLIQQAIKFKKKPVQPLLKNKRIALIFTKASTRTRVSFESAIHDLGGFSIYLSPDSIQMGRGESIDDTIKVLERYVHAIVIRNNDQADLERISKFSKVPIINGLTDFSHPCQALADLLTIKEKKGLSSKLKICYLGDGNNVAYSLGQACKILNLNLHIVTPKKFSCPKSVMESLPDIKFHQLDRFEQIAQVVTGSDVLYTDTWVSMGQEKEKKTRQKIFAPFQINEKLTKYAKKDYIFLHCLPAYRGLEVSSEIIDGPHSVIFDQAENRMHVQKAVLIHLLS